MLRWLRVLSRAARAGVLPNPRLLPRLRLLPVLLVFLGLVPGCGTPDGARDGDGATISRESFIEAYVDLRLQTLRDTTVELSPTDRHRILQEHGVTADDLLRFVEVHGDDPGYIGGVWAEVDERIRTAEEREEEGA